MLKLDAEKDIGANPILADEPASEPGVDAASNGAAAAADADMPAAAPPLDYEQQVRVRRTAP